MSFETVGPSLKSVVGESTEEYHHFVLAGGLIWAFSRKYHKQEKFNWGQRVTHKGGYAIAYDTKENKWGQVQEFAPLTTDENVDEVLFELGGEVYLLLLSNFGEIAFKQLYKWQNTAWTEVALQAPEAISSDWKEARVTAHVAEDTSATDRYITVNMNSMNLFKLHCDGKTAGIEMVGEVPAEQNPMRGQATAAIHSGHRVIICFMVMGCGYRWERNRFIIYDEAAKKFDSIMLSEETVTEGGCPHFGFSGASSHGVAPNGDWIHAGGSVHVGMTGSQFEGSIWALTNLSGEPKWKQLPISIPEELGNNSVVDSATGTAYLAGGNAVAKASLV